METVAPESVGLSASRLQGIDPCLDSEPFTSFFSTASGWGTLTLLADSLEVRLVKAELILDRLQVRGKLINIRPGLTIRAGKKIFIPLSGEKS